MGTRLENLRLTEVVDGDTIKVEIPLSSSSFPRRNNKNTDDTNETEPPVLREETTLRLIGVDTEESAVGTKPVTNAGQEATKQARQYFGCDELGFPPDDAAVYVDVEFDTAEPLHVCLAHHRGHWGRLLCYVYLKTNNNNGENYNLHTVRQGWSPYFCKYGQSRLYHAAFLQAEAEAQAERRLIWDAATNADGNSRNYNVLLPWWNLRASILQEYRTRGVQAGVLSFPRDYDTLVEAGRRGDTVTVLCDLVQGISETPGKGALLEEVGSSSKQPFWLWIPNRNSAPSIVHLIRNRYASAGEEGEGGRGYVYVTGQVVFYNTTPEIVLTSVSQLSDVPP